MPNLQKIDQLTLGRHHWLTLSDECYFLHTYVAGVGYQHSQSNRLIINLKKGMETQETEAWKYKKLAIQQVAKELSDALAQWPTGLTYVPVPPSKIRSDSAYDDRLLQILRGVNSGSSLDIREMIEQLQSTTAGHVGTGQRKTLPQLRSNYRLVQSAVSPVPSGLVIFDDVLTAGAHFRACHEMLQHQFPGVPIYGLFVARSDH